MISPEMVDSRSLSSVDLGANVLFDRLLMLVDDEGLLRLDTGLIHRKLFGMRDDVGEADVRVWLAQLADVDCIRFYMGCDGDWYLSVTNFYCYQNINKPTPTKCPVPPWNHRPDNGKEGRERAKMRCEPCENTCAKHVEKMDYGSTTVGLPPNRREEKGREEELSPKESSSFSSGCEEGGAGDNRRWLRRFAELLGVTGGQEVQR